MEVVKLTEKIWYYKNKKINTEIFLKEIEDLSNSSVDFYWHNYTNEYNPDGTKAESSVIGEVFCLKPNVDLYEKILNVFIDCIKHYLIHNNEQISMENLDINPVASRWDYSNCVLNIRRYLPGSTMSSHSDGILSLNGGGYTALFYLNEDYDGGELKFKDDNVSIKPEAGSVIIFPDGTEHEVLLVKSGMRYITNGYLYRKYPSPQGIL